MRTRANRTHRAAPLGGLLLAMSLLLAACADEPAAPQVASLPTESSEPPTASPDDASSAPAEGTASPTPEGEAAEAPASASEADRPRFRVDDTAERRTVLINAYYRCLLDNGAKEPEGDEMGVASGRDVDVETITVAIPFPEEAQAACVGVLPLEPPELEAATNPDFRDQALDYVACLREGGLWVELLGSEDLSWSYMEGHDIPEGTESLDRDCLIEAFGGKE